MSNLPPKTSFTDDQLLDKEQARKLLGGIGNTKFYSLIGSGTLSALKMGKRTFVRRSEINRYIDSLPSYTGGA